MAPDAQYALPFLAIWAVPLLVLVVTTRSRNETFGEAVKRLDVVLYWWMFGGLFACHTWWAGALYFAVTIPIALIAYWIGHLQAKRAARAERPTSARPSVRSAR